ncbi:11123_t:CDS:2, partial [Diversispora eburnea]
KELVYCTAGHSSNNIIMSIKIDSGYCIKFALKEINDSRHDLSVFLKELHVREDLKFLVVWALGAYPIEREDYDIEMALFVPLNPDEIDQETQAIFEKDKFFLMTLSMSTHLAILNKVVESNKCPLNVSLVGIPQEMPNEIKDDTIIKTLVTDYSGQENNFIINVVFSSRNSRLTHLKDIICPQESLIFVVGQMEIIDNEFYVYAKDVNSSMSRNLTRAKLLVTHKNIVSNLKDKSENEISVDSESSIKKNDISIGHDREETEEPPVKSNRGRRRVSRTK